MSTKKRSRKSAEAYLMALHSNQDSFIAPTYPGQVKSGVCGNGVIMLRVLSRLIATMPIETTFDMMVIFLITSVLFSWNSMAALV